MTLVDLRSTLAGAQSRLTRALSGVTEEQFKRRPQAAEGEPEPWCMAEVLAHMMAGERLWAQRIALALRDDGATVTPSLPDAHEREARAGRRAPVPQLVHGWLAARHLVETALEGLDDAALERCVWHPRLQRRLTVEWMVREKIAAHAHEHAEQVERLRQLVGAPQLSEER